MKITPWLSKYPSLLSAWLLSPYSLCRRLFANIQCCTEFPPKKFSFLLATWSISLHDWEHALDLHCHWPWCRSKDTGGCCRDLVMNSDAGCVDLWKLSCQCSDVSPHLGSSLIWLLYGWIWIFKTFFFFFSKMEFSESSHIHPEAIQSICDQCLIYRGICGFDLFKEWNLFPWPEIRHGGSSWWPWKGDLLEACLFGIKRKLKFHCFRIMQPLGEEKTKQNNKKPLFYLYWSFNSEIPKETLFQVSVTYLCSEILLLDF